LAVQIGFRNLSKEQKAELNERIEQEYFNYHFDKGVGEEKTATTGSDPVKRLSPTMLGAGLGENFVGSASLFASNEKRAAFRTTALEMQIEE